MFSAHWEMTDEPVGRESLCRCLISGINRFRPKSMEACNAELGGVWTCLLNEPQMKVTVPRGGGFFFCLLGSQVVHAILGNCTPIPLPPPTKKKFSSDLH